MQWFKTNWRVSTTTKTYILIMLKFAQLNYPNLTWSEPFLQLAISDWVCCLLLFVYWKCQEQWYNSTQTLVFLSCTFNFLFFFNFVFSLVLFSAFSFTSTINNSSSTTHSCVFTSSNADCVRLSLETGDIMVSMKAAAPFPPPVGYVLPLFHLLEKQRLKRPYWHRRMLIWFWVVGGRRP